MAWFSVSRAALMMAVGAVTFGALGARVAYLQTYGREKTVRQAERQQHRQSALPARRGSIFDRNGLLMAGTIQSRILFVDPKFMQEEFERASKEELKRREDREELRAKGKWPPKPETDPVKLAKAQQREAEEKQKFPMKYAPWDGVDSAVEKALTDIAELIMKDPAELVRKVQGKAQDRYLKLEMRLDDETVDAIRRLDIPGVGFQPMPVRSYPMDDVAAHVLGGVGGEAVGMDGLEMRYDRVLRGRDGFLREQKDGRNNAISVSSDDYAAPQHGKHLVLTIDANIQLIAEQELRASVVEQGAKFGEVVVLDPWTGEVLALANWPTYRPAEFSEIDKAAKPDPRMNRALVAPYEPGSTIKPFIVAPWVDTGKARLGEVMDTHSGHYTAPGKRRVSDMHGGYPRLCGWDVLVKSSNIGMAVMAERAGFETIVPGLERFGFGKTTGIELPAEAGGRLREFAKKDVLTPISMVQGYALMVTPLQLARGMAAISNGGTLLRPTIVRGLVKGQGEVEAPPATAGAAGSAGARLASASASPGGQTVLSPETADLIRRVLADVPVRGTGKRARSETYNLYGKTGTAHLVNPATKKYWENKYTSSFVGGAPFEHPRLVIAFILHEAEPREGQQNYTGGQAAAPGAGAVLERSLKYLGVPASPQLTQPPATIIPSLYQFESKLYTDWPENTRKARLERERTAGPAPATTTRPSIWGIPVDPVDPPSDDDDTVPPTQPDPTKNGMPDPAAGVG